MLYGIDLASHQGPNYNYDQNPDNRDFAIVKVSGGHSYKNEYRASQVQNARAAGLEIGLYHYMYEPSSGGGNMDVEFANFRAANNGIAQDGDLVVLDVEEYPRTVGRTPKQLLSDILRFAQLTRETYHCELIVYSGTYFLVENGLTDDILMDENTDLWIASWQRFLPAPQFMAPYRSAILWQYNADGIDKDIFYGTRADWRRRGINGGGIVLKETVKETLPEGYIADGHDSFQWPEGTAGVITHRETTFFQPQDGKFYRMVWDNQRGFSVEVINP